MEPIEINDPLFRQAVEAIDGGDLAALTRLIEDNPYLVTKRLDSPADGYFKNPYLLWFIADNPIRNGKPAANITDITKLLIDQVKRRATPANANEQLTYALGLVATGRIPKESGAQIQLLDLLIDAGAHPGSGLGALAHGNPEAARHLLKRGGKLELAAAVVLEMTDDVDRLLPSSTIEEQLTALTAAAFYGKAKMVEFLLDKGVDPNGYPDSSGGFHTHATPLHQAVAAGSLTCIIALVEAKASLEAKDKIYDGTPLDWAEYLKRDAVDDGVKENFALIEKYLKKQSV